MFKHFIKKYKEDILLCIGALTAGVVSFVVTLNVYPKIKDTQTVEEFLITKTNVVSDDSEDVREISEVLFDSGEEQEEILVIPVFENVKKSEVVQKIEEPILEETFSIKENLDFIWPLSGDVIKDFSADYLVYSETLNEWCTHSGIDISGNIGDFIVASENGIVENIYEDDKYGKTIVVSHEKGYKTIYSFVEIDNMLAKGKNVKKGETIARLAESRGFEFNDVSHLHFEMLKDNENISPTTEMR